MFSDEICEALAFTLVVALVVVGLLLLFWTTNYSTDSSFFPHDNYAEGFCNYLGFAESSNTLFNGFEFFTDCNDEPMIDWDCFYLDEFVINDEGLLTTELDYYLVCGNGEQVVTFNRDGDLVNMQTNLFGSIVWNPIPYSVVCLDGSVIDGFSNEGCFSVDICGNGDLI